MTKAIGVNTSVALGDATRKGLVIRDFVFIRAKNRTSGDAETIGFWNGMVPVTAAVTKPDDGATANREFQAGGALMQVPPIPAGLTLEVRTIRLKFSRLSEAVINAIRLYDAKMAPIEIHRGVFDPETRRLVDPAMCRFDGYINRSPIRLPKAGGEGVVELECVSRARIMTRTSGLLFSDEMMKERSNDRFGKFLDVAGDWRIWWGQEEKAIGDGKPRDKPKFFTKCAR